MHTYQNSTLKNVFYTMRHEIAIFVIFHLNSNKFIIAFEGVKIINNYYLWLKFYKWTVIYFKIPRWIKQIPIIEKNTFISTFILQHSKVKLLAWDFSCSYIVYDIFTFAKYYFYICAYFIVLITFLHSDILCLTLWSKYLFTIYFYLLIYDWIKATINLTRIFISYCKQTRRFFMSNGLFFK